MDLTLYQMAGSPPCHAVLLCLSALGLSANLKEILVLNGENRKPEFEKINPQHTIPVLDDKGFILTESRAIMGYLVDSYGSSDNLFPKDLKLRAQVNKYLYFDGTYLDVRMHDIYVFPILYGYKPSDLHVQKLNESLEVFDVLIGDKSFLVGDGLTIADIANVVTISVMESCGKDLSAFKNIGRWYANVRKAIPNYEELHQKGIDRLGQAYKDHKNNQ